MIFSGRKLLFAIADYAAILNKAIITYPLENFRYLKGRASTTMRPQTAKATRGRVEICPQISLRGDRYSNDT